MRTKKNQTTWILLGILAVLLVGGGIIYYFLSPKAASPIPGNSSEEQERSPAIDFTMNTPEGETVQFLDLLDGRPAVVNFWASTCGPCKVEMPDFQAAFDRHGEEFQFFMVNVGEAMNGETREKADAYLAQEGFTFPVYFDQDFSAVTNYGLRGFPTTFFFDGDGNVAAYAYGSISPSTLQKGMHMAAPDLIAAPT